MAGPARRETGRAGTPPRRGHAIDVRARHRRTRTPLTRAYATGAPTHATDDRDEETMGAIMERRTGWPVFPDVFGWVEAGMPGLQGHRGGTGSGSRSGSRTGRTS
ncbi:hypothetical protein NKH77_08470 [Streptomyces sp. M19]